MTASNIFFPSPEADEMLHSLVITGYRLSGYSSFKEFKQQIYKCHSDGRNWHPDYPYIIKHLDSCRFTGKAMLYNMLQLPYHIPFMTPVSLAMNNLGGSRAESPANALARPMQRMGPRLNYCPKCLQRQLGIYGRSLWERSHQLKFVSVCWRHGTKLISVEQRVQHPLLPADFEIPEIEYVFDSREIWLADQSRDLLVGNHGPSNLAAMAALYRARAIRLGYTRGRTIDYATIVDHLKKRFQEDFLLRTMQCADLDGVRSAIYAAMNSVRLAAHPIHHLFCIEVLFGDQRLFFSQLKALSRSEETAERDAALNPEETGPVHKQIFMGELRRSGQEVMVALHKNFPFTHSWILRNALVWSRRKIAELTVQGPKRPSQLRLAAKHRKFREALEEQMSRRAIHANAAAKVLTSESAVGAHSAQAFHRMSSELRRA